MSHTAQPDTATHSVVTSGEGESLWFNGALQDIKLPGAWSGDAISIVEVTARAGRATGMHTDPSHESFYILDGELLFHVDGSELRASTGDTVAIRRGVPHAFLIVSPLARFLVMNAPGTQDSFFRAGGIPAEHRDHDAALPPDMQRTAAAAAQHGIELLGPPPFAADTVTTRSG